MYHVYFEMAQIILFVILKMICWVLGALSAKVERWKYKINVFSKWYKQFIALFPDDASIHNLDFSEPLSLPASGSTGPASVDEEAVGVITAMGFTRNQAIKALKATVSIKRSSSRIGQENLRSGQSKTRT